MHPTNLAVLALGFCWLAGGSLGCAPDRHDDGSPISSTSAGAVMTLGALQLTVQPIGPEANQTPGVKALRHGSLGLSFPDRATFLPGGVVALSVAADDGEPTLQTTRWGRDDSMVGTWQAEAVEAADGRAQIPIGAGMVEWWAALDQGLEQGWTILDPAAGVGDLVIEVEVDGASVVVAPDGQEALLSQGSTLLTYGSLAAWDADGAELAAWLESTPGGFEIRVDDAEATYPIEVDPLVTTAAWSAESNDSYANYGWSVTSLGDVNNDGYDDVAVGAPNYGSSDTGRVYVNLGTSSGLSTSATTITGAGSSYDLGYSVAGAGDVNGDGYDDMVAGAPGYSSDTGRAYLYLGSASGMSTSASLTLTGAGSNYYFGTSVAGVGDVNGDGYADVAISAPRYSSSTGRVYVYLGSASGLASTPATTLTGAGSSYYFGNSVAGAGDVNGDGYDDVVIGAYGYSSYTGRAYVYHGSASGLSSTPGTTLTGAGSSYNFGYAVDAAGDVNGDGYDDLVVGAYRYSSYAGAAYLYLGSSSGIGSTGTGYGGSSGSYYGYAVAGVGDVDGDGYDDVAVGAYAYSSSTGRTYLYSGSSAGLVTTSATTLSGPSSSSEFGRAVAGAGDIDGNGHADLLVGAPDFDNGSTDEGGAYLYLATNGAMTLSSPNGGESWAGGSTQDITWSTAGILGATQIDLTYSTNGGSTYAYSIATGLATTATSYTWTVPAIDSTTVRVKATVLATSGDVYDASASNFTIDSTAPGTFDLTEPTNGDYGAATCYFDWSTSSGASAYDLWIDGAVVQSSLTTSYYTLTSTQALSDGAHYWYVKAYDAAGNVRQSTSTWTVIVESTPPATFSATAPEDGAWVPEIFSFAWDASSDADSGLSEYQVWIDGVDCLDGIAPSTTTVDYADLDCSLDEGAHTWYVVVLDAIGNSTTSDPAAGMTFYLDSWSPAQFDTWSGEVTDNEIAPDDGHATDLVAAVGDELIVSASGYWYFSNDGSCTSTSLRYTANGDSSSSYSRPVTGCAFGSLVGQIGTGSWFCVGTSEDVIVSSAGTLQFAANDDDQENCPTGSVSVVADHYDGWEPTSPADDAWIATSAETFSWPAVNDYGSGVASYSLVVDGRSVATGLTSTSYAVASLSDGRHSWYVEAEDAVGNTHESDHFTVYVDTTTPVVFSLDSPSDGDCSALLTPTLCWAASSDSGSGLAGYDLYIDGALNSSLSSSTTCTSVYLPSGVHEWYVVATDDVGNSRASTETFTLSVGTSAEVCDGVDNDCDGTWYGSTSDEISAATAQTASNRLRGDKVLVSSPTSLASLQAYLSVTAGSSLFWAVYEGATETGTFTRVAYHETTESTASLGWKNSGPLSVVLRRNYYYVFTVSWSASTTWYEDASAAFPLAISIGDVVGGVALSTSTPPISSTLSSTTTATGLRIVTGGEADGDEDGVAICAGDCDDSDAAIFPGATEACNGWDDDCDGALGATEIDGDGDGVMLCDSDCDDADASVHPGATEACNGQDDDCDGVLGATETDSDGDGVLLCDADCDDDDATRYPGATEACDGVDNDCDGRVPADEADGDLDLMRICAGDCDDADATIYLGATEACDGVDDDCDGSPGATEVDADTDGTMVCAGDCDDGNASVHPGATEACDGLDDDCDGALGASEVDADADGTMVCAGDCDDDNADIHPSATETCDGVDDDCDGAPDADEMDADGDGTMVCAGDCDDADLAVHPGATDVCDGQDNDCNGVVDDGSVDLDGDGAAGCTDCNDYDPAVAPGLTEACDGLDNDCDAMIPTDEIDLDGDGYSGCEGDCGPLDPAIHPRATEDCADGIDNDCDGMVDVDADADADGVTTCDGDCDDGDLEVHPGAEEVCNGLDDNCDGAVDEGSDEDADGVTTCDGDCDDTAPAVHPGRFEDCTDGIDNDCDGTIDEDTDADSDGFGACSGDCDDADAWVNAGRAELCDGIDNDCDGQADDGYDQDGDTWTTCQGDCADDDPGIHPSTDESCDEADEDCNGSVDDAPDMDGDGVGPCDGDCDDEDAAVGPEVEETCDNGVDDNCDGAVDAEDESCYSDTGETGVPDDTDVGPGDSSPDSGDPGKQPGVGGCGCGYPGKAGGALLPLLLGAAMISRSRRSRSNAGQPR